VTAAKTCPVEPAAATGAVSALQAELPELPRDTDGPVFKAPWEAQAFAMTLALHERGVFTWKEWAQTLAAVIGEVKRRGETDTGEDYYRHWLTALERIAATKELVTASLLLQRRQEWEEAARHTPHGQPIQLQSSGAR
jgi:nitrile hydratase accessory protein